MLVSLLGRVLLLCFISSLTFGCGGGGGSSSPIEPISMDSAAEGNSASSSTGIPQERTVRLNNFGNWHAIKNGNSNWQESLNALAQRDRVCMTEPYSAGSQITPQMLRSLNPNMKVYRLYDLSCKNTWDSEWKGQTPTNNWFRQTPISYDDIVNNDWWLRDGNGQIFKLADYAWFLDVGKPGFKEAFLREAISRTEGKGFDGFVLDCWYANAISVIKGRGLPVPNAYKTDEEWFQKAWKPFVDYIVDGMHRNGYSVIGNNAGYYYSSNQLTRWQRSKLDGVIYEGWATGWQGEWLPGSEIERRIESLKSDPLEVWVSSFSSATDTASSQIGLAMYYLAYTPSAPSDRFFNTTADTYIFWDSKWDLRIGNAISAATKISGMYAWIREYSNGLVLLNYESDRGVSYQLNGYYKDVEGQVFYGTITLPPHTAKILVKTDNL